MIYTSYFGNWRNFPEEFKKVSVARFPPKWTEVDIHSDELSPSVELFTAFKKGEISEEEFDKRYTDHLSTLDPKEIAETYDNSLLLCFEKQCGGCHRNLIIRWLRENRIKVEEL